MIKNLKIKLFDEISIIKMKNEGVNLVKHNNQIAKSEENHFRVFNLYSR